MRKIETSVDQQLTLEDQNVSDLSFSRAIKASMRAAKTANCAKPAVSKLRVLT